MNAFTSVGCKRKAAQKSGGDVRDGKIHRLGGDGHDVRVREYRRRTGSLRRRQDIAEGKIVVA